MVIIKKEYHKSYLILQKHHKKYKISLNQFCKKNKKYANLCHLWENEINKTKSASKKDAGIFNRNHGEGEGEFGVLSANFEECSGFIDFLGK